jgi:hypothetical protein
MECVNEVAPAPLQTAGGRDQPMKEVSPMTSVSATTPAVKSARRPRTVRPVGGLVRWLKPLVLPLGIGRLAITNAAGALEEYDVGAHVDGGRITGFRLVRDNDEGHDVYVLAPRWSCSCPHFTFHGHADPKGCKHAAALRAALAAAGLLDQLAAPVTADPRRGTP